ncbi:MAG TPA: PBP1A family penicillin-binding protein [Vicinamibacterales bacterium]|nr:PBP1A family penicillin-binding protein [Vicinamibacterales bacterium]
MRQLPPKMRYLHSSAALLRRLFNGRPRVLAAVVVALSVLTLSSTASLAWFSYDLTAGLPDREAVRDIGDMAQSTTIFDASDRPVFTIFKEQRIEIPLSGMSPNLIKAVISVEDQRFFDHSGVDAVRIAGAVLRNVRAGRRAEGGSTITQQLARQSFLSRDKTYRRKIKEVILAAYIESLYSKNDILQLYLNKVYFGDGLYGVEAAARGYLGKSASELTVDEAALLAGLIQSPSSYAPTVNLDRAIARRNVVLQTMVASGAIDQAMLEQARSAPVRLKNALEIKESFGLYFKEQVRRELVERFGWQRVYQGGLRVYTTIDPDLQQAAESIVEQGLEEIEKRRGFKHVPRAAQEVKPGSTPDYLQGALVTMDPATGHVLAMVGGRDFNESRFNRATQARRQSGSAFKPFVFAAAIEAGQTPATLITNLNAPIATLQGDWLPEDEHSDASSMTLRTALRTSSNRAAVQLLSSVGIRHAVTYAEKLNVGTPPSVPSLALGASDVTLVSLTAAYGAFAGKGIVRTPVLIRRVQDDEGHVLFENAGEERRAVSESTAFLMSSMLADVINAGTAYRARQAGFTLPAAGKTGTTNDYHDAWFIGYTPKLVTGVWVGFDAPRTIVSNGYAGELAVPIWASFMKRATRGDKAEWLERPSNVIGTNVCRVSGRLPNEGCQSVAVVTSDGGVERRSMVYTEYFVRGTQPTDTCDVHQPLSFMDRLAGIFGKDAGTPVSAGDLGLPPPRAASTSGSPATAPSVERKAAEKEEEREAKVEEPKKKRGFWSRLFGRGGDKDDDKKDDKKKDDEERGKEEQKRPSGRPPGG